MFYVQLNNGVVVNRTEFDGAMPENWPGRSQWLPHDTAQIGWTYAGNGQFTAPDLPVLLPTEPDGLPNLAPYQFHAMVALTGYDADIRAAIAADPDPGFAAAALAKYLYSTYYKRTDPFVEGLAQVVGLTGEQLDALWANALQF